MQPIKTWIKLCTVNCYKHITQNVDLIHVVYSSYPLTLLITTDDTNKVFSN